MRSALPRLLLLLAITGCATAAAPTDEAGLSARSSGRDEGPDAAASVDAAVQRDAQLAPKPDSGVRLDVGLDGSAVDLGVLGVEDLGFTDGGPVDAASLEDASTAVPPGTAMSEAFVVGRTAGRVPVDFMMTLDNTVGMEDTAAQVERHFSVLGTLVATAGLDAHFVLISERGTGQTPTDVCIGPPMAGPDCADTEAFMHLNHRVGDNEAFQAMLRCWDGCGGGNYRDHLRAGSLLQLIVVTDDDADRPWAQFAEQFLIRGRPEFVLHGLIGLQNDGCIEAIGREYIRGALETGGRVVDICREDFGAASRTILRAVQTQLQRYIPLSEPADPATVRVEAEVDGRRQIQQGNWRFDPATNRVVFHDINERPRLGDAVFIEYTTR